MTSRQRFEAWWKMTPTEELLTGPFDEDSMCIALNAWQAAERGMLERCLAITEPRSCEISDLIKELLNEKH